MQTKHNPVTFYIRLMLYTLTALCLRLVALAPLVLLYVLPADSQLRWLALACPLLLLFVVLPLRFSFAEAIVQKPRQRNFSYDRALGMRLYGEKLCESLLHALNVLKWGIPLLLMLGGCYYCYIRIGWSALLGSIVNIGKGLVGTWNSVANFFIRAFGGEQLTYQGGIAEGFIAIGAVLGVGLLIWLYGAVRNSATRYIWVLATQSERSPRTEVRRRLRGRRWRQFFVGMVNLVMWAPFIAVVAMSLKDVVSELSGNLMMAFSKNSDIGVKLLGTVKPLTFAFFCMYLPLLPARRWITASFATHNPRHFAADATEQQEAGGAEAERPETPATNLFEVVTPPTVEVEVPPQAQTAVEIEIPPQAQEVAPAEAPSHEPERRDAPAPSPYYDAPRESHEPERYEAPAEAEHPRDEAFEAVVGDSDDLLRAHDDEQPMRFDEGSYAAFQPELPATDDDDEPPTYTVGQ